MADVEEQKVNPFLMKAEGNTINKGAVAIEMSRAVAEAKGKLMLAKEFPRNEAAAYEAAMNSCSRKALAEKATYTYPKGGANVSGPSIRLAEELARVWGNIDYGIRELSQGDGVSEMEAYCWDLQTNTTSSQKFTVKHEMHTKNGVKKLTDPRDIYELTANQGGRRVRARIMAILPPDLLDEALLQCRATIAGSSTEPLADRVRKMLKAFGVYGVTAAHVETYLGKKLDAILIDEFVDMQGIYTSIRDKMSTTADWFNGKEGSEEDKTKLLELNKKLKPKKDKTLDEATPPAATPEASKDGTETIPFEETKDDKKEGQDPIKENEDLGL